MSQSPSEIPSHPHRVLQVLPHLIHGGTEFYLLRLLRKVERDRFDFGVCYIGTRDDIVGLYEETGLTPIPVGHRKPWHAIRTVFRLVRLIKQRRCQVVQTHSPLDRLYGQLAALISGVPVVDTLHSHYSASRYQEDSSPSRRRFWQRTRIAIEGWISRKTVVEIVAVSTSVEDTWRQSRARRDDGVRSITVVPPVIDFSLYLETVDRTAVERIRRDLRLEGADPVVVCVGRLVPGKNQEALIPLAARLCEEWPSTVLLIVGDGPNRQSLTRQIEKANVSDSVRLLGARDDVPILLAASDVLLLPSLSEGISLVAIEAVASGLPAVAFDLPAYETFLIDGLNAYKVPVGDEAEFTAHTLRMLRHLPEMKQTSLGVRQRLTGEFDGSIAADRLDAVYSRARGYS